MLDWQSYNKTYHYFHQEPKTFSFSASKSYLLAITQVKFLLEIHKYILYAYYTYRFLFGGKRIRLSPRVFVRELSRIDFKQGRTAFLFV